MKKFYFNNHKVFVRYTAAGVPSTEGLGKSLIPPSHFGPVNWSYGFDRQYRFPQTRRTHRKLEL